LEQAMRRLVVIFGVVLTLLLPAGAGALRVGPGDGTLVVKNAQGIVTLHVRGGIIGRIDTGTIEVGDPTPGDGAKPIVRGYEESRRLSPTRTQYSSAQSEIRFRLIGGWYNVRISAIGIDLSVVGRGTVTLDGTGFADQPGQASINGGPFQSMPNAPVRYTLGLPLPPGSK
jgi:hypothetical protein